jgi:hypothetical protein
MTIGRIFLAYMVVVGIAVGAVIVAMPQARDFRVPPYFWILIATAVFELAAYARGRGAPGTMLAMEMRLLGFVLAIVLMVVIPIVFGLPVRVF